MIYIQSENFRLLETGQVEDVRSAVQAAIELEHATMPPYLYALYSLGTSNSAIKQTLRSIVAEEMLHMMLAGNLLNAIGGTPSINTPAFVPSYPGPLPGSVHGCLDVHLKPFSRQLCEEVFMEIEEPERPLEFRVLSREAVAPPATIGQFYSRLKAALKDEYFTGPASRQVTSPLFDLPEEQQRIVDLVSAGKAIDFIVRQGEGTTDDPFDVPGQLAHYYQFAEIFKGRKLVPNPAATPDTPPDERYIYGGAPIVIESGILPVVENPRSVHYPAGSPARIKSDEFNRSYTGILAMLQEAFSGTPDAINEAIDLMQLQLRPLAQALVQITLEGGMRAGPTFEYLV
jgi:hypothetical protein